jgi:hypothetical protein
VDKGKFHVKNIVFLLLLMVANHVNGQKLPADTSMVETFPLDTVEFHSPKKAAMYSAMLPGLGQAYNKKYWKIPVVYVGIGAIGYFIGWNNKNYKIYKSAFGDITDGDDNTNSFMDLEAAKYYDLEDPTQYNNFKTGLNKQQEYYRRNRDLLIISMVGFYGLNIIDASVDAHFFDFDISENLSLNWEPTMNSYKNQLVYGFNCTFNF